MVQEEILYCIPHLLRLIKNSIIYLTLRLLTTSKCSSFQTPSDLRDELNYQMLNCLANKKTRYPPEANSVTTKTTIKEEFLDSHRTKGRPPNDLFCCFRSHGNSSVQKTVEFLPSIRTVLIWIRLLNAQEIILRQRLPYHNFFVTLYSSSTLFHLLVYLVYINSDTRVI